LTGRDVRAVALGQLRRHLDARRVDHIGNRLTGERRVADPVVGHRAAEIDAAERLEIRANGDEPVERRPNMQALDVAFGHLHREPGLVALLTLTVGRRVDRIAMGLDVSFDLREALLRFLERQHVLLRLDGAHELVRLHVEFGAPHVVARVQQRDFIVALLHRRLRIGLDDLLLGKLQIEPRLFEVEFLFGSIELDDDVAGSHRGAGVRQLDDLELAAHRGHGKLRRARRAQIADGVHRHLHAAALHMRRRNRLRQRGRDSTQHGDARDDQHDDCDEPVADHLPAASPPGSFNATRSFSATPAAIAI